MLLPNRKKNRAKPSQIEKTQLKPNQIKKNQPKLEKTKPKPSQIKKPSQSGFCSKKLNRIKTSRFEPVLVFLKKKLI
jgi:hypothetical protein